MLGGAAPGCYTRETLDAPTRDVFERYYRPLCELLRRHNFDGIDLDVEQKMSLPGIIRLVDALRADFGTEFIITLAPVAAAMLAMGNMSGFDYLELEAARGSDISWYNVQFYNNWGEVAALLPVMQALWVPEKLVVGTLTSPDNGHGYMTPAHLGQRLGVLGLAGVKHGGIMGWEYFNSTPGGLDAPWQWVEEMGKLVGSGRWTEDEVRAIREHVLESGVEEAALPKAFEYDSDSR